MNDLSTFINTALAEWSSHTTWYVYPDGNRDNGMIKVQADSEYQAKEEAYIYLKQVEENSKNMT